MQISTGTLPSSSVFGPFSPLGTYPTPYPSPLVSPFPAQSSFSSFLRPATSFPPQVEFNIVAWLKQRKLEEKAKQQAAKAAAKAKEKVSSSTEPPPSPPPAYLMISPIDPYPTNPFTPSLKQMRNSPDCWHWRTHF